jgi:F0F1-type ATP synthase membrane subunit b/b'
MTKENQNFENPEADLIKGSSKNKALKSRRLWPVYTAGITSIAWVVGFFVFSMIEGFFTSRQAMSTTEFALYAAGMTSPIVVFWLIALVYQRTDPLLEQRLDIAKGMAKTLAPIDQAQDRLKDISTNIEKQLKLIEAATDIAGQRIQNLENRFQDEVNHLFTATTDAEAKAASFKDMLKRERLALEMFASDMDVRINIAEETFSSLSKSIINTSENSRSEIEQASKFFAEQSKLMAQSVSETSEIVDGIEETLNNQRQEMTATAIESRNQMEEAFEAIMGRAGNLAREIERLDEASSKISTLIENRTAMVTAMSDEANQQADAFEATIKRQANELSTAAANAMSQAAQAGDEFSKQAHKIEKAAAETFERTESIFVEAGRSITATSAAAEAMARASADRAFGHIDSAAKQIQELSSNLRASAKDQATATLSQLKELLEGLQAQSSMIKTARENNSSELDLMVAKLADHAEMIGSAAGDAATNLKIAGSVMDKRSENLGQTLDDTKRRLDHVEEQIMKQRELLAKTSDEGTELLNQATHNLEKSTVGLRDSAETAATDIQDNAVKLEMQMEKINEKGTITTTAFTMASKKLREENQAFTGTIKMNLLAFGEAFESFTSARESFDGNSKDIITGLQSGAEALIQGTTLLVNSGESGADRMDVLAKKVADTAEATEANINMMSERLRSAINQARIEVKENIADLNNQAEDDITNLHNRFAKELGKAVSDLENASERARSEARSSVDDISITAEKLAKSTGLFVTKIETHDKAIKHAIKDDFINTSSLLIESLGSTSVDISRLLDVDIDDSAWRKYLEGDKGIFARKTSKMGGGKMRKAIDKRFKEDQEFKTICLKFIHDFDSLLERSSTEAHANTFNVTLMSSDMGKLYALLKFALE